jgi:polar amino acid transport system permease protein
MAGFLAAGFKMSLGIFALTLLFALPVALPLALGRMSKFWLWRKPVELFQMIIRGTPLMLQIMLVYFAPFYLFQVPLTGYRFPAVVIAFSINYAAYFSEIYRGGLEAIPSGQYEAAHVLGFTRRQTFFRIILPQMVKRILPPMSNEVITLIKDTALANVIAILEIFRVAHGMATTRMSVVPYLLAGAFYLLSTFFITRFFNYAERRLSYYE